MLIRYLQETCHKDNALERSAAVVAAVSVDTETLKCETGKCSRN